MRRLMPSQIRYCVLAVMLGSPLSSYAHHGVNGQFDQSKTVRVTGVITKIKLVNPHAYVYFDVENANGDTDSWRCELGTGSALRRAGWNASTFAKGKQITIEGAPARNTEFECHANKIVFSDGTVINRHGGVDVSETKKEVARSLTLEDGTPNIEGQWVSERPMRPGPPPGERKKRTNVARMPNSENMKSRGEPPRNGRRPEDATMPSFELTEAGSAALEGFQMEDMPRLHCQATSIIDDWTFDQLVNRIHQTNDDITINYGFMTINRTIHLDLDSHPENITPSVEGHSIGEWQDGVLVVDTIGFAPGYVRVTPHRNGTIPNSDQLHIIERFSMSEDGLTLHREYEIEDPVYLNGTVSGEDEVKYTDSEYLPYNCDDLTDESLSK